MPLQDVPRSYLLSSFLQLDTQTSQVGATVALLLGPEMLYGSRVWKNMPLLLGNIFVECIITQ